jgi:hypothetical protein
MNGVTAHNQVHFATRKSNVVENKRKSLEESLKDSSHKKEIGMVRTAGEGGVTEEVTEKGGVLYEEKGNSDCCRDCGVVFAIANSKVKALVKLERFV